MHWAWGWSSFHKSIVEEVFQWVYPYKIQYPANYLDSVPLSSLPRSCSSVKSWKGLFWSVFWSVLITVLPWTKPELSTPNCSLTPQPCSIRDKAQALQMKWKNAETVLPFLKKKVIAFSLLLHWHTKQNTNYALTDTIISVLWLLTNITKNKVAKMQALSYLFPTNLEMKTKLVKIKLLFIFFPNFFPSTSAFLLKSIFLSYM